MGQKRNLDFGHAEADMVIVFKPDACTLLSVHERAVAASRIDHKITAALLHKTSVDAGDPVVTQHQVTVFSAADGELLPAQGHPSVLPRDPDQQGRLRLGNTGARHCVTRMLSGGGGPVNLPAPWFVQ